MRILERGAVYCGDDIVGFKCARCGKVYDSMLGDYCMKCREEMEISRLMIDKLSRDS